MSILATIVAVLTFAGALASWIVGAVVYRRARQAGAAVSGQGASWFAAAVWPFLSKDIPGASAEHAAKLNKALVALFTCLMIALAATSLATNLSRLSR